MADEKQEPPALQHLFSLRAAAALAYTSATGQYTSSVDTLNKVARIIGAVVPVFARLNDGDPARVLPLELAEGEFQRGGDALRFPDGRQTITGLLILHRQLGAAISHVRDAYGAAGQSGAG